MDQILIYLSELWAYILSDGHELSLGGVVVVGVVIALMGVIKNLKPIKGIKNSVVRKVILAWSSIVLTVALTVVSVFLNEFKQDHFLAICIFNSVGTIVLYWLYENTALRNFVAWVGKKTILKLLVRKPKTIEEAKEFASEVNKDVESLLQSVNSESLSKYKDDDLKNL